MKNMMRIMLGATLCALLVFPAVCFGAGALEKLQGPWVVAVEETIEANPDMAEGIKASDGKEFKAMLVQELSAIKFTFDVAAKTLASEGHNVPHAVQPFEASNETDTAVDVASGGETHRLTLTATGMDMALDNSGIIKLKRP